MGRFLAFMLFAWLTISAVFRDFDVATSWLPTRSYLGDDPYVFMVRVGVIATLIVGAFYVTFVLSPWVRLKLFNMFDTWSRGVVGVLVSVVLLAGLFGVMAVAFALAINETFNYVYYDEHFRPILDAHQQSDPDRFFGFTKIGLLYVAEGVIYSIVAIFIFTNVSIATVLFYRKNVIPWFYGLKRSDKPLAVKTARMLLVAGWSVSVFMGFWHMDMLFLVAWIIRGGGDVWQATITLPTDDNPVVALGMVKDDVLFMAEAMISPVLLFVLCVMTAYIFRPLAALVLGFYRQWPQSYEPAVRPLYAVMAFVAVCALAPHAYSAYPLIKHVAGI